jgi:molecular chaperone IbpA
MFTTNDLHKAFDPFTIGFGDLTTTLEQIRDVASQNVGSFPPYNIKQVSENKYVIEMAIAGFAKTDVDLTLEGNKLIIKGSSKDETPEENYLHKGIAQRNFTRQFTLADKVEIKDAEVINGMLKVWLQNMVKTQDFVKKITIK